MANLEAETEAKVEMPIPNCSKISTTRLIKPRVKAEKENYFHFSTLSSSIMKAVEVKVLSVGVLEAQPGMERVIQVQNVKTKEVQLLGHVLLVLECVAYFWCPTVVQQSMKIAPTSEIQDFQMHSQKHLEFNIPLTKVLQWCAF